MPPRPPIHVLAYGDSGAFKSTFAASFPKPMIVFMWDPIGKEMPYLRRGVPGGIKFDDDLGVRYQEVFSKKTGSLLVRVEYYADEGWGKDFDLPTAYSSFLARLSGFSTEYAVWKTAVFDSVTFAELAARKWHQYVLNKTAKDPRQWFGGSTDLIEEILLGRFASLPMNVVVCAHVDEDKDELHGTHVRSPKMPGQRLRKGASAGYAEFYHLTMHKDAQGNPMPVVQTKADNLWNAATQINAPTGCPPDYAALWESFDQETSE